MVEFTAIGTYRRKKIIGVLEVFEDEDSMPVAVDLLGAEEFIGDIPEGYVTLHEFFKLHKTKGMPSKKHVKALMKECTLSEIWVEIEGNDDFWAYYNHKCNTCKRTCKQSHKVELVSCPQYEPI
jgi:hypothetical protein